MTFTTVWTRERVIDAMQAWEREHGDAPAQNDWNPYAARYVIHDEARAQRYEQYGDALPSFSTVFRCFGSWGAALEAAGFQARPNNGGGGNQMRRRDVMRTHCVNGHEYTPENTYTVPATGRRQCRRCVMAAVYRYRQRKKDQS